VFGLRRRFVGKKGEEVDLLGLEEMCEDM